MQPQSNHNPYPPQHAAAASPHLRAHLAHPLEGEQQVPIPVRSLKLRGSRVSSHAIGKEREGNVESGAVVVDIHRREGEWGGGDRAGNGGARQKAAAAGGGRRGVGREAGVGD
eukprot:scaffold8807_cov110-Isochrysis_galbana.AAC.2